MGFTLLTFPLFSVDCIIGCYNVMAMSHCDELHKHMPLYVNFHQHGGVG